MTSTNYSGSAIKVAATQLTAEGYTAAEVEAILAATMAAGLALPRPGDGAVVERFD